MRRSLKKYKENNPIKGSYLLWGGVSGLFGLLGIGIGTGTLLITKKEKELSSFLLGGFGSFITMMMIKNRGTKITVDKIPGE